MFAELTDRLSSTQLVGTLIVGSMTPLILFLFNYVFIPTMVDTMSYYEEFENKSIRHRTNLFKQFFFIIINSVFLPITGLTTVSSFLLYLSQNEYSSLQLELSGKFLSSSEFFLKYLIQLTFLTNMI